MKISFATLAFCTLPLLPAAQSEKGAAHLNPQSVNPQSVIRAVVIGISDYQDPAIPDLQFAHRDAEAFAAWLQSAAGGSVPPENIQVLLNEKATMGRVAMALWALMTQCVEGDQAIIYFSGHGDVETKTIRQNGFLLCYDSPSATYVAGALPLGYLQDVVSTLSVQNKARVLVISDACHAGKLAGSDIGGPQATAQNLARQFANEVKILSCQPNEFSLEGTQWGGGRGCFSYHLTDGLYGLADRNADDLVTLFELEMYLGEKVPEETAPHKQFPFAIGEKTARMARVDAPALAALRQVKSGQSPMLNSTGMKGWEDDLVSATDSVTQALYYAFKDALEHGALLDTAGGYQNAWALLPQLLERESLSELHGLLRRNLAAALQDEAQQALNALLDDDPYEANQWQYNPGKYTRYPEYLAKSIELLGEQHYMYETLMAKQLFFKASNLVNAKAFFSEGVTHIDSFNREARSLLSAALRYEPDGAYLYYGIGKSYDYNSLFIDSFYYFNNKAIEMSPSWIMPRLDIIQNCLYSQFTGDWKSCENHLLQALALKPDSYVLTEKMAWLYQRMLRMDDAIDLAWKMTRLRPDLPNGYATLGSTHFRLREYPLAYKYSRKALEIDSTVWSWPMEVIGFLFLSTRQYESSFMLYDEFINKGYESSAWWIPSYTFSLMNQTDLTKKYFNWYYTKYPPNEEEKLFRLGVDIYTLFHDGYLKETRDRIQEYNALCSRISGVATAEKAAYFGLSGQIFELEQQPDSAEIYFKKAVNYYSDLNCSWAGKPVCAEARYHYARFLLTQNRPADAEAQLLKAEEIDPRNPLNYLGMAALHAAQKNDKEALDWLAKALEWYYPDYDEIMDEPLFKKIRKTKRFKALMKQYFPDGSDRPKVEALARKYLPEVFGG